jgi:RNA polymerase sigma factor (sigma-70 family)
MPNPSPSIAADVLERAKRGDRAAHAELYAVLATPVFTLARRMLASKALAEDVLQETFVEVLGKIGSFRGDAEVGTWIKRIAINKCLMHVRSSWISRRGPFDEETVGDARSVALDDRLALERALDQVPDLARAVVWLHDVEGYTHVEIARLMGRSTSFSKSQLARAHVRLRSLLDGPADATETNLCTPELKTC